MVRYHGVLSSHAKARSEVVPHPDIATTPGRVVELELLGDNESAGNEHPDAACIWISKYHASP